VIVPFQQFQVGAERGGWKPGAIVEIGTLWGGAAGVANGYGGGFLITGDDYGFTCDVGGSLVPFSIGTRDFKPFHILRLGKLNSRKEGAVSGS